MNRTTMTADSNSKDSLEETVTPGTTPRSKAKKKSALSKLLDRKKRQVGSGIDTDSEFGSRASLQTKELPAVPLEPKIVVKDQLQLKCFPCKGSPLEEIPKPTPRKNSRSSDEHENFVNLDSGVKTNSFENNDLNLGSPCKGTSSDTAVYRFRNMRMAPDHNDVTDNLKQAPFVPKPPSTPRTPRVSPPSTVEKRNLDTFSSGDDPDSGLKWKMSSDRGKLHSHSSHSNSRDSETTRTHDEPTLDSMLDTKSSLPESSGVLKSSSAGSDPGDPSEDGADKDNCLQKPLLTDSKKSKKLNKKAMSLHTDVSQPTPRSARLSSLPPKTAPPPLEADVRSLALRTSYKADPSYRPSSSTILGLFSKPLSDGNIGGMSSSRHGFDNLSFTSSSVMPVITTQEARSRSFLVGSVSSGSTSILGAEELERYFPDRKIHVWVGSWNMNELKDVSVSLNDFILPEACEYVQDIYAVGTQENDMNKKEWEIRVQETLGPSHVLLHSLSHGSLHLVIFIRRDLIWFCSEIGPIDFKSDRKDAIPEDDIVSLRAVTMVKTKGAIGISFSVFGTSFLFINCHLTSDRGSSKNASRLLDYHRVIQELKLPNNSKAKNSSQISVKSVDTTSRFDCVYWCGDLNFRLEQRREAVEGKVSQMSAVDSIPHFDELLHGDQLSKYITEGKVFEGFQEGRINFKPTFKFDVNSDQYDTSAKRRNPSYTDRILFRSRKKNHISCSHYDAVMSIKESDHRPVYALFEAVLRPGRDNISLCAGQFDRDVYLEANRRRAQAQLLKGQKNSSVCLIQ